MPLAATLPKMRTLDQIREQIGLKYSFRVGHRVADSGRLGVLVRSILPRLAFLLDGVEWRRS